MNAPCKVSSVPLCMLLTREQATHPLQPEPPTTSLFLPSYLNETQLVGVLSFRMSATAVAIAASKTSAMVPTNLNF